MWKLYGGISADDVQFGDENSDGAIRWRRALLGRNSVCSSLQRHFFAYVKER